MRFNHKPTRYRIFDAKSQQPILAEDGDKDKNSPTATPKKDVDDQDGDDLKHVDSSKGGYGHGSGFDKDE
ncbi:hypothetical protein GGR26_002014 [Lewinella marina]|uniref:Uncharacterized protein n=1 Tax=Neolewinella marina TaxID=438751 RepID=A0A2G0CH80_9BACT|nr:hypothetical protein [Neolewinella marina]NJB86246.1 hypothetical protein [Neolewinella marina]PHK99280.1 hypothetical protein CGL56_07445 [Neolewinella marina]